MKENLSKTSFLDYSILIPYVLLSLIGIIMVFSTSVPYQLQHGASPYKLVINQAAFMLLSYVAIAIVYKSKLRMLKSRKFIGTVLLLLIFSFLLVRVGPASIAPRINGARGWIRIPGIGTLQPAEFAKLFFVWYLASVFAEKQEALAKKGLKEIFTGKSIIQKLIGGWRGPVLILLIIEFVMPDLGNTLIMALIALVMIAVSGISWRYFSGYGKMLLGLFLAAIAFIFARGGNIIPGHYANKRLIAYVNPFQDLSDSGHQLANSYYAIVNGGWFGRGLGNSIEKNGFLPESTTDFIFPVVVEELGLIGAIIILGILFFMIIRILQVGIRARNPFNAMIAIGVAALLLISVFVNIGGAIGLIPETGVTFPFISQGGSSFMINSIGIAFVLNVAADEKRQEIKELSNTRKYFTDQDSLK